MTSPSGPQHPPRYGSHPPHQAWPNQASPQAPPPPQAAHRAVPPQADPPAPTQAYPPATPQGYPAGPPQRYPAGPPQAYPAPQAYPGVPPQAHGVASPDGGQPGWSAPSMPPPQPPPYGWGAPPAGPAVIDVGKADAKRFVIGAIVSGTLGLIVICAGLTGAVEGGIGVAIAAIAIGGVFLLIGFLPLLMRKKAFRPRRLVIEQPGIRWDDPQGKPWAVSWHELAAVAISKHGALEVDHSMNAKISGAISDRVLGESVLVRLDLFPADPGFHQRHPEMADLWSQDRYRLSFGRSPRLIPQIDAAMRHFQPMLYRGVQETEGFMGLR